MPDQLIVDVPVVDAAAAVIQRVTGSVGDAPWGECESADLGAVMVQDAAADFSRAWEAALIGLAGAIEGLRSSMGAAVEVFETVDQKLAGRHGPRVAR